MGDRGNIAIVQHDGSGSRVYLYTHWGGSEVPEVLQTALMKKWRWDDEAYLARIIFDTLTSGEQGRGTGYGISTSIQDNENPILVVDTAQQRVFAEGGSGGSWTFEEFVTLENANAAVRGDDDGGYG